MSHSASTPDNPTQLRALTGAEFSVWGRGADPIDLLAKDPAEGATVRPRARGARSWISSAFESAGVAAGLTTASNRTDRPRV